MVSPPRRNPWGYGGGGGRGKSFGGGKVCESIAAMEARIAQVCAAQRDAMAVDGIGDDCASFDDQSALKGGNTEESKGGATSGSCPGVASDAYVDSRREDAALAKDRGTPDLGKGADRGHDRMDTELDQLGSCGQEPRTIPTKDREARIADRAAKQGPSILNGGTANCSSGTLPGCSTEIGMELDPEMIKTKCGLMVNSVSDSNVELQFFCRNKDSGMAEPEISESCTLSACAITRENLETQNGLERAARGSQELNGAALNAHSKVNSWKSLGKQVLNGAELKELNGAELNAHSMDTDDSFLGDHISKPVENAWKRAAANPWKKPEHIKVVWPIKDLSCNPESELLLNMEAIEGNQRRLEKALVGKLMGKKLPFSILLAELKRRWGHVGSFQIVMVSEDCFTCIFESTDARDTILVGGPWMVAGHILGLDKWTHNFSPDSLNGFSAPIWIRLPKLPLLYWDNDNLARIASKVGTPLLIDAFTGSWGRGSYARICVRIDLSKKLPKGIWIPGVQGRFFQNIEYEGISILCSSCGMVGHRPIECPHIVRSKQNLEKEKSTAPTKLQPGHPFMQKSNQPLNGESSKSATKEVEHHDMSSNSEEPGSWTLVTHRNNKQKQRWKKTANEGVLPQKAPEAQNMETGTQNEVFKFNSINAPNQNEESVCVTPTPPPVQSQLGRESPKLMLRKN